MLTNFRSTDLSHIGETVGLECVTCTILCGLEWIHLLFGKPPFLQNHAFTTLWTCVRQGASKIFHFKRWHAGKLLFLTVISTFLVRTFPTAIKVQVTRLDRSVTCHLARWLVPRLEWYVTVPFWLSFRLNRHFQRPYNGGSKCAGLNGQPGERRE